MSKSVKAFLISAWILCVLGVALYVLDVFIPWDTLLWIPATALLVAGVTIMITLAREVQE